jgi:hypothetical protein
VTILLALKITATVNGFNPLSTRHSYSRRRACRNSQSGFASIRFRRGLHSRIVGLSMVITGAEFQSALDASFILTVFSGGEHVFLHVSIRIRRVIQSHDPSRISPLSALIRFNPLYTRKQSQMEQRVRANIVATDVSIRFRRDHTLLPLPRASPTCP